MTFRNLLARCAVGTVLAFACAWACAGTGRPRPAPVATVTVDAVRAGRVVPASYLGFSVEWDSVEPYARRAALLQLLARFASSAGPVALRIGGDTADQAWWDPRGQPRPRIVLQDIAGATLQAVAQLARALRGPVTLDLNLALRDPGNALALSRAARRWLPRGALETLEIGNEPDLYTHAHTFRVPGHVHRRVRKRQRYGPRAYGRDVASYLAVLSRGLRPAPRLAVAGFAGGSWWPRLPALLKSWAGRAGALSGHLYALPDCHAATPAASWLMSPAASRGRAESLAALARIARRTGLPLRVTELNSAACGGRAGLSDSFASALWLTDTLFALLRDGADQADVHTWDHARYAPFALTRTGVSVRPPLVAMRAFARGAPAASRLIPVRIASAGTLRGWATLDAVGTVRLVLIAPDAVRARLAAGECRAIWIATARGQAGRECPRGGVLALPARSVAVVTGQRR